MKTPKPNRKPWRASIGAIVIAGIFTVVSFVACAAPFAATIDAGKGSITLSLTGATSADSSGAGSSASRTIMPTPPEIASVADTFTVSFSSANGFSHNDVTIGAAELGAGKTIGDLEFGLWAVKVSGAKSGTTTLEGAGSVMVSSGKTTALSVALVPPQNAAGTGSLSLKVSFPADCADSLTWSIRKADGTLVGNENTVTSFATKTSADGTLMASATLSAGAIPSGTYSLVMSFARNDSNGFPTLARGIFRESLNVWPGYTSDRWVKADGSLSDTRTFASGDFFDASAVLGDLTFTPLPSDDFTFDFTSPSGLLGTCSQSSLRFTPTQGMPGQSITFQWNNGAETAIASSVASPALSLATGTNTLLIKVTAANHSSSRSYTYTVYGTGSNGSGVPQFVSKSGMKLVQVAGGSFSRDGGASNIATVSPFLMGKYEVSQEQFNTVMGFNPSRFQSPFVSANLRRPVEQVYWFDALEFCNRLSLQDGLTPVYTLTNKTFGTGDTVNNITSATVAIDLTRNGYRLPTETELAWAFAGADSTNPGQTNTSGWAKRFAGDDGGNAIADYVWAYDQLAGLSQGNADGFITMTVGTKRPNELGIYDLSGNVNEWCWDWGSNPGSYPNGSFRNYQGATTGLGHIYAGLGALNSFSQYTANTTQCKGWTDGFASFKTIGFRMVRNQAPLYSLVYLPNSPSTGAAPASQAYAANTAGLTVPANTGDLYKSGNLFSSWNTDAAGAGTDWLPFASIPANTSLKLYAKWRPAPTATWAKSPVSVTGAGTSTKSDCNFTNVISDNSSAYALGWQSNTVDGSPSGTAYAFTYTYATGVSATTATNGVGASGYYPVLVKYNSAGTALWAVTADNRSTYSDAVVDPQGNIWVCGSQYDPTVVYKTTSGNNATITATGSAGAPILLKYDSTGKLLWWTAASGTGSGTARFTSMALDPSGRWLYVAGGQTGTVNYGGASAPVSANNSSTTSMNNAVLVKYDLRSGGAVAQWARISVNGTPSTGMCNFSNVAVDSAGGVYAAGIQYAGSADFGNGVSATVTAANAYNRGLLVKYDDAGNAQWARVVQAPTASQFNALACYGTDLLACIDINGTGVSNFGSLPVTMTTSSSVLSKWSAGGACQWVRAPVSASETWYTAMAIDAGGNVFVSGTAQTGGTLDLGNSVSFSPPVADTGFVAAYSNQGTAQWMKGPTAVSGGDTSQLNGVALLGNSPVAVGSVTNLSTYTWASGITNTGLSNATSHTWTSMIVKF